MKGRNEIKLNTPTTIEAIEFYLKEKVFADKEFKVVSVEITSAPKAYGAATDGIDVVLQGTEEETK